MSQRPAIVKIAESEEGDQARVVITLAYQDAEYVGEAFGDASPGARPRLVGDATLRAVEAVTDNRINMHLEAVATTSLGGAQVAMAQVRLEGDAVTLVGSSLIGGTDRSAATVRAVLDAINRRLADVL
jgi:hypothetical protein